MKITQYGIPNRFAQVALCAMSLFAFHGANATGVNGFRPTDTNVIAPGTNLVVTAWKQVGGGAGGCGPSGVQIAPSWVLTSHHSHCTAGSTFRRIVNGQLLIAAVDADYATPAMVASDVHLSHLASPLPYEGEFVPLVDRFYNLGNPLVENPSAPLDGYLRDTDILLVGNGVDEAGLHDLKAGWAPSCCAGGPFLSNIAPSNPHFASFAGATNGDSGGGVFVVNHAIPQGALAGVMQVEAAGLGSTRGFAPGVREDISAIMANPRLNPSNEQLIWVSAIEAKGEVVRVEAPQLTNEGGVFDALGVPINGLITSSYPGTLRVRIPQPVTSHELGHPDSGGAPIDVGGYRLRLLREDHMSIGPNSFDFSTTLMPHQRDFFIGSGVGPGTWYLTATAFKASNELVTNPETGEQTFVRTEEPESYAATRVKFVIPANNARPQKLQGLDVVVEAMDLGDGKPHWCATISAQLGKGPRPEGIIWSTAGRTWKMPVDDFGGVCDTWDDTGTRTVFPVTAYPYIGAAIGPGTTVNVVGPATP